MKKILLSIITVALVTVVSVKATGAFFTDTKTSTGNTFVTGTLNVNIDDQNSTDPFVNESLATNWQPGEERLVNFDILNTGSLPVQLRGFAAGSWGVPALDSQNMVRVTKVERFNGVSWEDVLVNPTGITGFFYYTNTGLVGGTFFDVASGARAQLRLTVKLDDTAGNDFQNNTFTSSIHVEARQATIPTTVWP